MSDMSYPTKENSQFMNVQGGEKKVMKKILSVALSTAMAFSMFASVAFGETATTPQAKFDALAAKGILNGYEDGQAHLERDLNRAEFAKIITKLFNLTEVTGKLSYKDKGYTASLWAVPYIEAATTAGFMKGKDTVKGIFDYSGKVTVEEVATVLSRALKLEQPTTTDNSASAWAKGYAQSVLNAGLVPQGTNFKANATRSLVVEAAYAVSNLTSAPAIKTVEVLDATTLSVTFVDGKTAEIKLTTALVADKATEVSFTYNGYSYKYTVTLTAPQVKSVTVLNAKQLQVVFNRTVDQTSAETVANYTYQTNGMASAVAIPAKGSKGNATDGTVIELGSDKRTVTITTQANLNASLGGVTAGTPFKFNVKNVKDTSAATVADFNTTLSVTDSVAPVLSAASATAKTTTNVVTLTFSEPVDPTGAIVYVGGVAATSVVGSTPTTIKVTTSQTLTAGTSYDISALNFKDYAGNFLNPNPTALSVTVSSDIVAPVVQSVTAARDNKLVINFDKSIDSASVQTAGAVKVLDGNGTAISLDLSKITVDGKTLNVGLPTLPFNTSGTFTGTVILTDAITDTLGNAKATSSHAISVTKDIVAPVVQSASYTTSKVSNGEIVVKFSEDVAAIGATTAFTLINSNGVVVASPALTGLSSDADDATQIRVTTGTSLSAGTYTLRVNSGVAKDLSSQSNTNGAAVLTFTVGASSDSDKPVVLTTTAAAKAATTSKSGSSIAITLTDNIGLDLASVQSVSNYLLNGKALPVGAYVTVNVTAGTESSATGVTATINLPAGSVAETANYTLNVTNVKDKAGNIANAVAITGLALVDDVAPTLKTATISSNGLIVLGFTESVSGVTAATYEDFEFLINNIPVTGAQLKNIATFVPGTGTDAGKYVVTLKQTVVDGRLFLDLDNNGTYSAGDISIQTGSTATSGTAFDVNKVTSLTVKITATASHVTDLSTLANPITTGTSISVK
ncbi:beta strand repeat-containing protein [Paenibacillus sp. HW567]|uniref:beta strand repeat-containing protein n=1 Tax=Paenibacillus sp. HW567 TaxID=1034769 RepID=UPI00035D33F8|nr:S-layer homology domain-containing protein [Paenibacillus sp. HW567]